MGFIHSNALGLLGPWVLEMIFLRWWRVPKMCVVCYGDIQVLGHVLDPSREPIYTFGIWENQGDLKMSLDIN